MKNHYKIERCGNGKDIKIIVNAGEKSITIYEISFTMKISDMLIQEVIKMEKISKIPLDLNKTITSMFWFGDDYLIELSFEGKKGFCMEKGDGEIAYTQALINLLSNLEPEKKVVWVG
jgi:hypothetical protein